MRSFARAKPCSFSRREIHQAGPTPPKSHAADMMAFSIFGGDGYIICDNYSPDTKRYPQVNRAKMERHKIKRWGNRPLLLEAVESIETPVNVDISGQVIGRNFTGNLETYYRDHKKGRRKY